MLQKFGPTSFLIEDVGSSVGTGEDGNEEDGNEDGEDDEDGEDRENRIGDSSVRVTESVTEDNEESVCLSTSGTSASNSSNSRRNKQISSTNYINENNIKGKFKVCLGAPFHRCTCNLRVPNRVHTTHVQVPLISVVKE